jgi:hypothetical protein
MIELKELVDIVTRNKVKSIEIIGDNSDKKSKLTQFYDLVAEGAVDSDEEAFYLLYQNPEDKNAYYKLKHSLRERLLNTMFFIDVKKAKYSTVKKAKLECQKIISLFNLLRTKGAIRNAIKIAKRGLKIALEYEFTQETIFLAENLRVHYATVIGDRKRFLYYDEIVNRSQELYLAEGKAKSRYLDLVSLYVKDKSTKSYVRNLAGQYLGEVENMQVETKSINLFYYKSMLEIIYHMSINDYKTTIQVCRLTLEKINAYRYLSTRAKISVSLQYIACCIHLKYFDEGKKSISECLEIVEEGMTAWFKLQELYLTLCLHTKNYIEAWHTYQRAIRHKKFQTLFANAREVWKIYEAWLYFLIKAGKVDPLNGATYQKFRIGRFLNEVPTFSKDKRGLNVSILIVQIVLLLQDKRRYELIDRMEAIAQYKHRYLDKEQNYRSNVFIRMLLEVSKVGFKREGALQRADKYLGMLDEVPLEVSNQSHDLEILPYEDIWDIVVAQLD